MRHTERQGDRQIDRYRDGRIDRKIRKKGIETDTVNYKVFLRLKKQFDPVYFYYIYNQNTSEYTYVFGLCFNM